MEKEGAQGLVNFAADSRGINESSDVDKVGIFKLRWNSLVSQIKMRPVQDFEFENDTWWNQSNVEEYHRNMTKVVQYGQTSISIHPHTILWQ